MSKQFRLPPHPWDSNPGEAIDRRVAQLRGVFGIIGALSGPADKEPLSIHREDFSGLVWLVEDYLHDIEECGKRTTLNKEVA